MTFVSHLNNLRLDQLDHGWVKTVYDSEFLEFGDLPPEYEVAIESVDLRSTFHEIIISIDSWLNTESIPSEDKSWSSLAIIQHKKVLALLAYIIDCGCKNVRNKDYRDNALLATRVYYKLLSIPGCKAYQIYHSQLFTQSLACLGFPIAMCDEEFNFNPDELTYEVNLLLIELLDFVTNLKAIVEHLQLSPDDMNFEDILSNLLEVTSCVVINDLDVDFTVLTKISATTYSIIDLLLCDTNGEPKEKAIRLLFKCFLPKLIASCSDKHFYDLVRASYVAYSSVLLSRFGKPALCGFMILLEHLCYTLTGLERADVRGNRAELVVGLMSLLPQICYKKHFSWILQLSTTAKTAHRHLAMEMLVKLLGNDPEEVHPPVQTNETIAEDGVSGVEGIAPDQQSGTSANNDQTGGDNQRGVEHEHAISTLDDSGNVSQEHQLGDPEHELTEEERVSLLHERRHKVLHAEILRAMYERVQDESGTLRTRAINVFTQCLTSKRPAVIDAIKELNGDGEVPRLMVVAVRSVCDERAVVRKAGAALVLRLLADTDAPPPQPTDLSILVSLCRDASILVRSSAINALGELLTLRPSEAVVDAFLTGPMHQVTDPETKVQEQVLNLIQQVFIDRISQFKEPGYGDPMPWMFLAGILRQKMKKHLQKVCLMLSKSAKCINHRLVDKVSTHLGVWNDERDLQCLILLTSLARHVDYSDVAFVLEYYYKLADNEHIRDSRLSSLTLDLLGSWSRFLHSMERSLLREHLVRRLASAHDDGCRILRAQLAAQLDPDNLTWATELMQLSERRALEKNDVYEALRAADLSLVAPVQPSPALLGVFLNAISDPPPEMQEAQAGASVAGAGRLCVRARSCAATAAPVFAALLARASEPLPVRLNALMALSDICARYTCIVEPLLGSMCGCLSSQSPAPLRRKAARELTRLLLGGFLRLRTPLYYRYCALLADEDDDVREPAEYYVTFGLTTDTIYHHFVECVLYYNHDEKDHIQFDARQLIYDVMLQRMSLVQKLNIQCRLAREVLEHAADLTDEGDEELPPAMNAALLDTITLLCGPRMKLPKNPQKSGDANDIDNLQERVTTNIVSHKMKCTVAEVLVPAVLRLYSRLSPRGGQINTYLVHIANDLLKDYEQEIKELFEDNEELMKHIQRFQETIGLEARSGNVRNLVTTTAPPEPDTPRAPRRRPRGERPERPPESRRRALHI